MSRAKRRETYLAIAPLLVSKWLCDDTVEGIEDTMLLHVEGGAQESRINRRNELKYGVRWRVFVAVLVEATDLFCDCTSLGE